MNQIYCAISQIFKDKKSLIIFIASTLIFFLLFIAIPIWTTPGNTIEFQLKIFRIKDYVLMVTLSILAGLNFALYWYGLQSKKRAQAVSKSIAGGAVAGVAGIFAAIVGTAACASCLVTLFAIIGLGTGSVLFILENQSYFLLGAIAVMLASLYFATRKINKICESCPK